MITTKKERKSPYKEKYFAPIDDERTTEVLEVEGELPPEFEGMFVRNGPNPRFQAEGKHHWFDGDGMIHGVRIKDGKASYRNRYVKSKDFQAETEAGHSLFTGILSPIDFENPRGPDKNTSNTDLVWHDGRLLSLWWLGGEPYAVSVPDLETVGALTYKDKLPGMSAHPKVDELTGDMMFIDYSLYKQPYLQYGVIGGDGELKQFETIEIPGPRLQHDIAITKNYTVLMDLPMLWRPEMIKQGKRNVEFDRSLPSRFGIIPRFGKNADIKWFESDPCYIFHTVNSWEEGDEVVMVACRITNPLPESREDLRDNTVTKLAFLKMQPVLYEWRFNMKTGQVRERQLDDVYNEFPRINYKYLGQKSKFSYNSRIPAEPQLYFDAMIKYNTDTGSSQTFEYGAGNYGSEPVFAPRPGATDEDDGWAISIVNKGNSNESELLVLDGKDISRSPVARVKIPYRVPLGFHSWWIREDQIAGQKKGLN